MMAGTYLGTAGKRPDIIQLANKKVQAKNNHVKVRNGPISL